MRYKIHNSLNKGVAKLVRLLWLIKCNHFVYFFVVVLWYNKTKFIKVSLPFVLVIIKGQKVCGLLMSPW